MKCQRTTSHEQAEHELSDFQIHDAFRLLRHEMQALRNQRLGCVSLRVIFKHGRLRCVSVCEVVLSLDSYPHPPTKQKFVSCFIPLFKIIWFSFDNMLLKQCSWGTPHVES